MALYDALFQPIDVGPVTIPNRIVRSPHGTGLSGEPLIAYHEARARGGVGMSTIEATGVHRLAPTGLPVYSDDSMPFLSQIAERVHPYGMKLFLQLYHPGASYGSPAAAEVWSASAIPNPMSGVVPVEMTKAMIDDVVESFASAARRVRDAGLDGVDIHASSGYLLHEFLSPALNQRTDEYGGSPENRLRLLREVVAAVRSAVQDSPFAVGVRLPNEDYVPGGLTPEQNAEIARAIDPDVDYVSLHMGAYWRFHKLIAPADDPLGVEMTANAPITRVTSKPTIVVGRIMTLDHADHIVSSGEADMVSMVRALIADPNLVNKARNSQEAKIRPCIGSNMGCVGQLMSTGRISCVVNIAAGKENAVTHEPEQQADAPKRLLVVGGGPAGLEFARTAALRGHDVELHEAMSVLGGQVTIAARAPKRADLGAITSWLADEVDSLGVRIQLNSFVDADLVAQKRADAVILATGTTPRDDGRQIATPAAAVPGFDLPHVYSSWDVLGFGDVPTLRGPAVVFDDTGSFEAISVADVLLAQGLQVTMVGRLDAPGASLPYPPVTAGAARERLMNGNFDFIGSHHLRRIDNESVEIGVLFTERSRTLPARTVVFVGCSEPNRELGKTLEGNGPPVHLVGDVRGRSSIMTAIHAGATLGRTI